VIPILLVAIVFAVVASASHARGEATWAPTRPALPPSPIAVLGQYARVGAMPPPPVIICAIAEAESIGRNDLASDIVRVFVAPVVAQHHGLQTPRPSAAQRRAAPRHVIDVEAEEEPEPVRAPRAPRGTALSDEQLRAALNANPERFVREAASASGLNDLADAAGIDRSVLPAAAAVMAATAAAHALSSPIKGVDPIDWSRFCDKLEREPAEYVSARHVGRYRQRKERLQELGIDPRSVIGSPDAQRAALDTDLADAHHHASASGLADDHVGRKIALPGGEAATEVTLSGVLGVIQAAGLDGAAGWFERQGDRKKYPHTTVAFTRTNGVF
jgi:hypothetical protein